VSGVPLFRVFGDNVAELSSALGRSYLMPTEPMVCLPWPVDRKVILMRSSLTYAQVGPLSSLDLDGGCSPAVVGVLG
jgi:hypothetical protein